MLQSNIQRQWLCPADVYDCMQPHSLPTNILWPAQVTKEARRVAARLDRAEEQTLKHHATNHERLKLATMYSLGHKVCITCLTVTGSGTICQDRLAIGQSDRVYRS